MYRKRGNSIKMAHIRKRLRQCADMFKKKSYVYGLSVAHEWNKEQIAEPWQHPFFRSHLSVV